jgi:hypothetical protein
MNGQEMLDTITSDADVVVEIQRFKISNEALFVTKVQQKRPRYNLAF